jgi:hypothetical protein
MTIKQVYNVCVLDVGSPRLGNLGWCFIDVKTSREYVGDDLESLIELLSKQVKERGVILGLEAPLFVPVRQDVQLATKGRKGEGNRPWSGTAGAQVLAINLPIMGYLFQHIYKNTPTVSFFMNEDQFEGEKLQIMLFEALVSGSDKGSSHIHDAQIMAQECAQYAKMLALPPSILEYEEGVKFFNIAGSALLYCGITEDIRVSRMACPIFKPKKREG